VFCIASAGLMVSGVIYFPMQALLAAIFILAGVLPYYSLVSNFDQFPGSGMMAP